MDPAGRPVLVTGAAGFLGANLVRALLGAGARVDAVVRPGGSHWRLAGLAHEPGLRLHEADVRDGAGVAGVVGAARPEAIFHLAASGGHARTAEQREEALATSVLGTHHVLQAAARRGVARVVHAGSPLECEPRDGRLDEGAPLGPVTFRGMAKAAAFLVCREAARAGLPVVILRPFHVYGPWEGNGRLVPAAILAALRGEELPLTAPGLRRDPVFVADVVAAFLLALRPELPPGEVLHIGSGQAWANEEIVAVAAECAGRPVPTVLDGYPSSATDPGAPIADPSRAARVLGWRPGHSLREGMARTVEWFRDHMDLYGRSLPATARSR